MPKLKPGSTVRSPISRRSYRLERVIGLGGYGEAYEAVDLESGARVCFKHTRDQASWHREAYFGELLRGRRRVIQTHESFPILPSRGGRDPLRFGLVMELATHGAVADYLERTERPWPEARAKREILALLRLLDELHGGSATHRDITPFNIFVCSNGTLKLGDFGIARHTLGGRQSKPDAFNPDYVTRGFLDSEHRAWTAVDDVFQMGQLLALLIQGETVRRLTLRDLRTLEVSEETEAVIRRAIGPRGRRYRDAWEMLLALRGDPPPDPVALAGLAGRRVAFCGSLSISRFDAELLVVEAGGEIASRITADLDVLVVGRHARRGTTRPAALVAAERLRTKGARIHMIGERELRRLVRRDG